MNPIFQTPESQGCVYIGSFTVPGKCKSKSNFKPRGRMYLSPELLAFERTGAFLAKAALRVKTPYNAGYVQITMYGKNKIHIDLSNSPKSIIDFLVNAGIFTDDINVGVNTPFCIIGTEEKTVLDVWGKDL